MIAAFIDLLRANATASDRVRRRDLAAWGTLERKGSVWSWRWSGIGLALPELLPDPVPCVSADAAWMALEATVSVITRDVRRLSAG